MEVKVPLPKALSKKVSPKDIDEESTQNIQIDNDIPEFLMAAQRNMEISELEGSIEDNLNDENGEYWFQITINSINLIKI